jgi:hypothetical protein
VLAATLSAGLWPFHSPANQVGWLTSVNGLQLGRHGTLLSSGSFTPARPPSLAGNSIEIWLQPARAQNTGTILAFYNPGEPQQFSFHQSNRFLGLQADLESATSTNLARVAYLSGISRDRARVFITIIAGPQGTATYIDGAPAQEFPGFRPGNRAFTGQLVVGNSPIETSSWSGRLFGLAIYNRELTAVQVRTHYQSWTAKGRPDIRADDQSSAVYLFDEHSGNVVHNQVSSGIDLLIPERYTMLDEKFLEPFWKEFRPLWSYWKNVGINIAGFIPLGVFFCAYLTSLLPVRRPALTTILLGTAVSLTIEILQAYLPTRDSGTTDLITNTFGTLLGVMLYRWRPTLITEAFERLPAPRRSS